MSAAPTSIIQNTTEMKFRVYRSIINTMNNDFENICGSSSILSQWQADGVSSQERDRRLRFYNDHLKPVWDAQDVQDAERASLLRFYFSEGRNGPGVKRAENEAAEAAARQQGYIHSMAIEGLTLDDADAAILSTIARERMDYDEGVAYAIFRLREDGIIPDPSTP